MNARKLLSPAVEAASAAIATAEATLRLVFVLFPKRCRSAAASFNAPMALSRPSVTYWLTCLTEGKETHQHIL
ncbi:hypothetical protein KC19_12G039900 [Ceratodon purpureus]|uniref:Uncharacterized protein n=1 Tax=Ceratodon purpureus TaxID=3225 RepID=A0A8T0G3C0_CERPU|nr:hypothetical protein KC19_12G039900 [Ceratodon purpureus]